MKLAADPSKASVKSWMKKMVTDYVDSKTGEVNATGLAEGAADEFDKKDLGGWLDDESHWVWDAAQEVADEYEKKHKKTATKIAERFMRKANTPDQWEKAGRLIEGGAKGEVNKSFDFQMSKVQSEIAKVQPEFVDAARVLSKHKTLGYGNTEAPAVLLRPLRQMQAVSEAFARAKASVDRLIEGALKDTGSSPHDL